MMRTTSLRHADVIVSGDLLALYPFRRIPILSSCR